VSALTQLRAFHTHRSRVHNRTSRPHSWAVPAYIPQSQSHSFSSRSNVRFPINSFSTLALSPFHSTAQQNSDIKSGPRIFMLLCTCIVACARVLDFAPNPKPPLSCIHTTVLDSCSLCRSKDLNVNSGVELAFGDLVALGRANRFCQALNAVREVLS
jgi:hypothetical protein